MFNIGLGEILFIAVLALIFIGPERLPKVLRQMGEIVATLRGYAAEISREYSQELEPIRELQSFASDIDPRRQIGKVLDVSTDSAELAKRTIAPPTPPALGAANPMTQISAALQPEAPAPPPDAEPGPPATSDPDPDPAA